MLCFIAGSNLRRKGQRKQEEAWTRAEEKDREGAGCKRETEWKISIGWDSQEIRRIRDSLRARKDEAH